MNILTPYGSIVDLDDDNERESDGLMVTSELDTPFNIHLCNGGFSATNIIAVFTPNGTFELHFK